MKLSNDLWIWIKSELNCSIMNRLRSLLRISCSCWIMHANLMSPIHKFTRSVAYAIGFLFLNSLKQSALQLQRVVIQTKRQLLEDGNHPPNAQAAVQELLTTLFSAVYNHQDEEGRCFSDSLQELPEFDEVEGKK